MKHMESAVVVSTARTPLAKSHRGAFNHTPAAELAAQAVRAAVQRSGLEPDAVEELMLGCGYPEGAAGRNVARSSALLAGLGLGCAGSVHSRFCASGLDAIATAAQRIACGDAQVLAAGGVENISTLRRHTATGLHSGVLPSLQQAHAGLYWPMIDTADEVAQRYGISREDQDAFALLSQQRTAAAQAAGRFQDEIIPVSTQMAVPDPAQPEGSDSPPLLQPVTLERDNCNRPGTTLQALAALAPVRGAQHRVTAGNASQLSDGASACVLMAPSRAERLGLQPLGAFRGYAVAGCAPEEMGIGPVLAVPRLLQRHGLKVQDIDLWELNEAFAAQALYCQRALDIPLERLNVNGGAIAIGHPFGMTGARLVGHLLLEGRRRRARWAVATLCVSGGMGVAALLEVF
jgi:acetyl-CoA C-acetyltransferase